MRYWLVGVVACTACANEGSLPDITLDKIQIDIVADLGHVRVRHSGDFANAQCAPYDPLPAIGECAAFSDAIECGETTESCITRLAFKDRAYTFPADGHLGYTPFDFDNDYTGGSLDIEGCGDDISVDIPAGPYPQAFAPTTQLLQTGAQYTVSATWPAVDGVSDYYVFFANLYDYQSCRLAEISHVFATGFAPRTDSSSVSVQPLAPPVETSSSRFDVRVWVGDSASAPIVANEEGR
ncbi:MAG TPA: hypothetical protein VGM90_02405 [Kofleriaceae bacterium]|jgi:hypothetical protein